MPAIVHALSITGAMTWAITWALILGFGLAMLRMMGGSPDSHDHDHMDAQASH